MTVGANSNTRVAAVLRVTDTHVEMDLGTTSYRHSVGGLTVEATSLVAELAELRIRHAATSSMINAVGIALGESFLDGQAGVALADALADAAARGHDLQLSVETASARLASLPWESIIVPVGGAREVPREPLGLLPNVFVCRGAGAAPSSRPPVVQEPPTRFRIVVAIASPENGRGSLLNYEVELDHVLSALAPAIDSGAIDVDILNWGTADAIRAALTARPTDILHISSHGIPGYLCLETATGDDDLIDADGVMSRLLPQGRAMPFLVLSACHTGRAASRDAADGSEASTALAATLLAHGAPGAVAMTDEVSDQFATVLAHQFYRGIAADPSADPVTTFCRARRDLAQQFAADPARARLAAEWVIPTVFAPYDIHRPRRTLSGTEAATTKLDGAVAPLAFVGRREELRGLVRIATSPSPWVVLSGLSGIGKSALARELVRLLGADAGHPVWVADRHTPGRILDSVWNQLCRGRHRESFLAWARGDDPTDGWRKRLRHVQSKVLSRQRITLVLDGIDANLEDAGTGFQLDAETSEFLEQWMTCGSNAGLIITSRKAFAQASESSVRARQRFLGPLSGAETAKLILALPSVTDVIARNPRNRASIDWVGGHPGALRRIDELLTKSDVAVDEAVDQALRRVGVDSELDRIAAQWTPNDPVGRMVRGLTVYRMPVDTIGVNWQLAEQAPEAVDDVLNPDRPDDYAVTVTQASSGRLARRTPLEMNRERAMRIAMTWGLVYHGFDPDAHGQTYSVPNAVKAFLEDSSGRDMRRAHLRAANYWRWREDRLVDSGDFEFTDTTCVDEVHYHLMAGAGTDAAAKITDELVLSLFSIGTPAAAEKVILLTRDLIRRPETSDVERGSARLAVVSAYCMLGRLDDAVAEGRRAIVEVRGSGEPLLESICSLTVAFALQRAGEFAAAVALLEESLAHGGELDPVLRALGNALAGTLASESGDFDEARRLAEEALELVALGNASRRSESGLRRVQEIAGVVAYGPQSVQQSSGSGFASVLDLIGAEAEIIATIQLASVHLVRAEIAEARRAAQRAAKLAADFQTPMYVAAATHLLGSIELTSGNIELADATLRRARTQAATYGDRLNEARSSMVLGDLSQVRGDLGGAAVWYHRALGSAEAAGNDNLCAITCLMLGLLSLGDVGDVPVRDWIARAEGYGDSVDHPAVRAVKSYVTAIDLNLRGDTFEAARYLQAALDLLASTGGNPTFEGDILRFTALNALEGNDRAAFRSTLEALADIVDRTGNRSSRAMLLFLTALEMGDAAETPDDLARVKAQLDEARGMFESLQSHGMAAMVAEATLTMSEEFELTSSETTERAQHMQNLARVIGQGDSVVDAVTYEIVRALDEDRIADARALFDDLRSRRPRKVSAAWRIDILAGRVLYAEGDLSEAWDHFVHAHEEAVAAEHWGDAVETAGGLADLAAEAGQPDLAVDAGVRAFVVNSRRDNYTMTLRLVDGLAEMCARFAEDDESRSWSEGLVRATEECEVPFEKAVCYRKLGGDAVERPEREDEAAERWLRRALILNTGSLPQHLHERRFVRGILARLLLRQERYPEIVAIQAEGVQGDEEDDMGVLSGVRAMLPDDEFLEILRRTVDDATCERIMSETVTPWWERGNRPI
ncbi:CHAT domain-containing protein [Nocardia bovistercoris]|uniref:CHAT domain-containing protein n=1 Tax=Nocardia bovistercoris TaxID=2785916 RepID=A0A931I9S4_9NOCA|nr:CHAT domain-containing protein [Nocardia bovistercoris]MBH0775960.1 CHAT domain-containing protein [Nocardia bovistercoris]